MVSRSYVEAIGKAVQLAKDNKPTYLKIANDIVETLDSVLSKKSQKIIGINNRIKTSQSLTEKLIRKKIYKKTNEPKEMLNSIRDIIGILIECAFVGDEEHVYNAVMDELERVDDDWARCKANDRIYLKISDMQPQILKNNTETYKIDGIYKMDEDYKFELQIKSMVKVFWSEVEHNIVYKNNYYMPDDEYVVSTLAAIKKNLFGLDDMLSLINTHTSTINSITLLSNLTLNERLLKQLISETFNDKIMRAIRIKINIKDTRDLACKFIMREHSKLSEDEQQKHYYYLISTFKNLHKNEHIFNIPSEQVNITNDDYFEAKEYLYHLTSHDFEWDLYFNILRSIYPEKHMDYLLDNTIGLLIEELGIGDQDINSQNQLLIDCIKQGTIIS